MRRIVPGRSQRGFALLITLGLVVLLTVIVTFALVIAGQEQRQSGKQVHNATMVNAAESALQFGASYLQTKYPANGWDAYLGYFVDHPPVLDTSAHIAATMAAVAAFDPNLIVTNASGYSCFIYARDDMDEYGSGTNNPRHDNNQLIFVGAVCTSSTPASNQNKPILAELQTPLIYVATGKYGL